MVLLYFLIWYPFEARGSVLSSSELDPFFYTRDYQKVRRLSIKLKPLKINQ